MLRSLLFTTLAALAAAMTGCCSVPVGCEPDCGYCDGYVAEPCVPHRPLREARRRWLCGNGCGEMYMGEWRNSPPDCCDPCDNAVQCTPPVVYRPYLLHGLLTGWYGKRYPRGWDECCDVCCLDECCCDSGCDCGPEVIEGESVKSAGCASCTSSATRGLVTRSSIKRSLPARANTRGYQMPEPYREDIQTGSSSKTIRR